MTEAVSFAIEELGEYLGSPNGSFRVSLFGRIPSNKKLALLSSNTINHCSLRRKFFLKTRIQYRKHLNSVCSTDLEEINAVLTNLMRR